MPEFKNKEEYEKWKEQRIKELRESPEKIVNNPSNRTSANDENRVQDVMKKSFEIAGKFIDDFIDKYALNKEISKERHALNRKISENLSDVGKYLFGLPVSGSIENVKCYRTKEDFVFTRNEFMPLEGEIGRIPRNSIIRIDILDKSQITQSALNPAGFLIGGTIGALYATTGMKVKYEEYSVLIEWEGGESIKNTTVFTYEGEKSANLANEVANYFKKYVKQNEDNMKENEKQCPFCAETIKKEAKICRFCNRDL
jgi:predicted ribosome quality control (RQC) complex YloA/Tae2 family protein